MIIIILILSASCKPKGENQEKIENSDSNKISGDSSLTLIQDSLAKFIPPENFLFSYSECKQNCNDYERIILKKYKGDTLILKIGSIQNCTGRFRLDLKSFGDTLDLDIKIKEKIIKRKSGKIDSIMEWTACDCYFYFNIGIKNVQKEYKAILINSHNFGRKPQTVDELDNIELADTLIKNK